MNKQTCENLVKSTVEKSNKTFPGLNLVEPTVSYFNDSKTAGFANCSQNVVRFNSIIMSEQTDEAFENTIVHEVAHLVTHKLYPRAKQSHGPEFKLVMRCLDAVPTTYHSYSVVNINTPRQQNKYEYYCHGCRTNHSLSTNLHKKIQNGDVRVCRLTKAKISKEHFVKVLKLKAK